MKSMCLVCISLVIGGLIAGCGTDEEAVQARADAEEMVAEAEEEISDVEADVVDAERQLAKGEECSELLGPFMRELQDLDGLLAVGLNYEDHTASIQDISLAYNRIDFKDLGFDCLDAGIGAERAFRLYARADDVWGGCIEDFGCDPDSIDPQLQRSWNEASSAYRQADRNLEDLTEEVASELERLEDDLSDAEEAFDEAEDELNALAES